MGCVYPCGAQNDWNNTDKKQNNELIATRISSGWRMYVDYRKLNLSTRKDHFPLPFMDQMLERLAGKSFYYGYGGYNQIVINHEDQENTTFTCLFGTYAYRRMLFCLCNAPATFQRCMMSIFSDYVERIIEVSWMISRCMVILLISV